MNKVLLTAALLCVVVTTKAQDSLFTYSKIITADSVTKEQIYDRALIWASKAFNDSKSAINVKEKESGIIAGKAYTQNFYKYPTKKDSIIGLIYVDYYFDWLIQIKDGKLRFSISNANVHSDPELFTLTTSATGPSKGLMLSRARNDAEWQSSKAYFTARLERLTADLNKEILTSTDF